MKYNPHSTFRMINQSDNVSQSFNTKKRKDLMASLAIDALGMATYLIPALGEAADIVIAPIVSILIYSVHRTTFGAVAGLLEEILPFTDIIPSATIIWFYRYFLKKENTYNDFMNNFRKKDAILINRK